MFLGETISGAPSQGPYKAILEQKQGKKWISSVKAKNNDYLATKKASND